MRGRCGEGWDGIGEILEGGDWRASVIISARNITVIPDIGTSCRTRTVYRTQRTEQNRTEIRETLEYIKIK
jgi:hypothetical protein